MDDNTWKIIYITLGGLSSMVCLAAIILVFVLKLHRNVLYRLTIYQAFTAMLFGGALIASAATNSIELAGVCYYIGWVKVMAASCLTVHLLALVVCHKNLKRFELVYIAASLIVPVPFGVVPTVLLDTGFINVTAYNMALFHHMMEVIYSPGVVIALLSSLASIFVGVTLCCRLWRKKEYALLHDGQLHRKALCEALPLISYPVVFLILAVATFSITWTGDVIAAVLYPSWSLSAGLQLIIHVCVVMKYTQLHVRVGANSEQTTLHHSSLKGKQSTTYFSIQTEQ